jgi:hypothetical protein
MTLWRRRAEKRALAKSGERVPRRRRHCRTMTQMTQQGRVIYIASICPAKSESHLGHDTAQRAL